MMPLAKAQLTDILDSCQFIQVVCHDQTFDQYCDNRMLRRAVEREFEIIGEGLKRLRDAEPDILETIAAAHAIIGFRNRLAHGYDTIDDAIVWGIVQGHIPKLINDLRTYLLE